MKVWVVNCGDTGCDDPEYVAVAKVFARPMDAIYSMEKSVMDDCESLGAEAWWNEMHDMAVIELDGGRQIVYTINQMETL